MRRLVEIHSLVAGMEARSHEPYRISATWFLQEAAN
jgi:hypothetical protein